MNSNRKRRIFTAFFCPLLLSCLFWGCGNTVGDSTESSANTSANADVAYLDSADMFTDRDKEVGYSESESTIITLADGNSSCSDSSVSINGDTITISAEGTYILSGSLSDGQVIVDAADAKLQLVLNNAAISCDTSAALYVKDADKVFVTLAPDSANTFTNTSDYVAIDDNNIDAVIFSKKDITLNGSGTLNIQASYGHGIVSKKDLAITGGTYNITAANHALSGKNSVRIADGTFALTAGKDGIHSENTDEMEKGFIYVSGGDFHIDCESDGFDGDYTVQFDGGNIEIAAGDDGIHSDSDLIVTAINLHITKSYEGLEGETITIIGGEAHVTSSDDGLNAAGGDKSGGGFDEVDDSNFINITGGTLYVNAEGDGIDSNGNMTILGGEIYVSGPTNGGNGALDYAGSAVISGGTVVAVGSNGMAMNFGTDSTQGSMLVTVADTLLTGELTLTDSDGNVLLRYTPEKSYNSVVISCADLTEGETYTLTTADVTTTVELTSLIYGENDMGGGGGMRGGHQKPFSKEPPKAPDGQRVTPPDGNTNPMEKPSNENFSTDSTM